MVYEHFIQLYFIQKILNLYLSYSPYPKCSCKNNLCNTSSALDLHSWLRNGDCRKYQLISQHLMKIFHCDWRNDFSHRDIFHHQSNTTMNFASPPPLEFFFVGVRPTFAKNKLYSHTETQLPCTRTPPPQNPDASRQAGLSEDIDK